MPMSMPTFVPPTKPSMRQDGAVCGASPPKRTLAGRARRFLLTHTCDVVVPQAAIVQQGERDSPGGQPKRSIRGLPQELCDRKDGVAGGLNTICKALSQHTSGRRQQHRDVTERALSNSSMLLQADDVVGHIAPNPAARQQLSCSDERGVKQVRASIDVREPRAHALHRASPEQRAAWVEEWERRFRLVRHRDCQPLNISAAPPTACQAVGVCLCIAHARGRSVLPGRPSGKARPT